MNKKLTLLVLSIMVGAVFFIVWRYYYIKSDAKPKIQIYEYDCEFSWEMKQDIPRVLRALSNEENAATTNNYTMLIENNVIPENREAKKITLVDSLSQYAHWPLLSEVKVPAGSLEVRVVIIISEDNMNVFRFCRHHQQWTGYYTGFRYINKKLIPDGDDWKFEYDRNIHPDRSLVFELTPQTSWKNVGGKVEELGILTIPYSTKQPNEKVAIYGVGYLVEINDGGQYRIYHYNNPVKQDGSEAKKFIKIMDIFRHEFYQSIPGEKWSWF